MASAWMLVATLLFAIMGACVKLASEIYSISEIVLYRGVIGVLMLGALSLRSGRTLRTAFPLAHAWRGAIGVFSLWLWFYAIAKLPLATAVTLNYMSPIWIALFLFMMGWWHSKNHVEWPLVASILFSFVGVVLVLRPAFASQQWFGGLMGLTSGAMAAQAYLQVRKLGRMGEPEYRVVFYFSCSNVIAGLAVSMFDTAPVPWHHVDWRGGALLLALGVTATLAQVAMTRAYRVGKTLVVANLQYSGIIFSSVIGAVLWGDLFDWHVWLGMAIILASGIAVTFYNTRNTERGAAVSDTDPIASET